MYLRMCVHICSSLLYVYKTKRKRDNQGEKTYFVLPTSKDFLCGLQNVQGGTKVNREPGARDLA